jgi:hypothetical protein
MTVVGLITNNDETAYREELGPLTVWCQVNNLSTNISKTKELIVDLGTPLSSSTGRSTASIFPVYTSQRR